MKRASSIVLVAASLAAATAWAAATQKERIDLSAPLLPYYLGASSNIEGPANYPTDQQVRVDYVKKNTYTFEELLNLCAPQYPGITVQKPGDPPLTHPQLKANFDLVAQCSYEKYTVKPYWIPQLVDDVDVCTVKLGADWRLLTEADVASFTPDDFQYIADTLSGVSQGSSWGAFYFSLHAYVRAADGTLKMADLSPGATQRILPLPVNNAGWNADPRWHLESDVVPRCIRRTVSFVN